MLHLSLSSSQSIRSLQAHSQDPVAPTPLAKHPVNSALVYLLLLTGFLQVLPAVALQGCCAEVLHQTPLGIVTRPLHIHTKAHGSSTAHVWVMVGAATLCSHCCVRGPPTSTLTYMRSVDTAHLLHTRWGWPKHERCSPTKRTDRHG